MGVMDWLRPWRVRSGLQRGHIVARAGLPLRPDRGQVRRISGANSHTYGRSSGFLTRNVAQLGLAAYKVRGRVPDPDHLRPVGALAGQSPTDQTLYEFLAGIVGDLSCMTTPTSP